MPACLLDSNVWLAAAFAKHPAHAVSRRVLYSASADEPALWCRATQQSFLRLASTPVITQAYGVPKTSNGDAWAAARCQLRWHVATITLAGAPLVIDASAAPVG